MNNKILLGSIIAVVILVLVSFTGVVGYSCVKSNSVKTSPLFNVRSKRAIGEDSKDLTCDYIGKGIKLPFPKRDDRAVLTQKVIDRISKMDDKAFERFIASVIDSIQKNNRFNGIKPDRIREALYLLRDNDELIPIFDADINLNQITGGVGLITIGPTCCCITFDEGIRGILGCIVALLLLPFILPILFIFWCYPPLATGLVCRTLDCPKTLRKLLP